MRSGRDGYVRPRAAVTCSGGYRDEMDELIADNERESAEAHAASPAALAR